MTHSEVIKTILRFVVTMRIIYPTPADYDGQLAWGERMLGAVKALYGIEARQIDDALSANGGYTFKGAPGHNGLFYISRAVDRELFLAEQEAAG